MLLIAATLFTLAYIAYEYGHVYLYGRKGKRKFWYIRFGGKAVRGSMVLLSVLAIFTFVSFLPERTSETTTGSIFYEFKFY